VLSKFFLCMISLVRETCNSYSMPCHRFAFTVVFNVRAFRFGVCGFCCGDTEFAGLESDVCDNLFVLLSPLQILRNGFIWCIVTIALNCRPTSVSSTLALIIGKQVFSCE